MMFSMDIICSSFVFSVPPITNRIGNKHTFHMKTNMLYIYRRRKNSYLVFRLPSYLKVVLTLLILVPVIDAAAVIVGGRFSSSSSLARRDAEFL